MSGFTDELVQVQQEEDGTYTIEIKELEIIEDGYTLDEARQRIIDVLSDNKNPHQHPARLAEIGSELEVLEAQKDNLLNEKHRLESQVNTPIQATELLEELPRFNTNLRLFEINHPLEQHFGQQIICIGIIMTDDRDNDGDRDVSPVLHTTRRIKRV